MRDARRVRTTLDIDDDVLVAAKEIAAVNRSTIGKELSRLARKGLTPEKPLHKVRNGVPLLPPRPPGSPPLTLELIKELQDED